MNTPLYQAFAAVMAQTHWSTVETQNLWMAIEQSYGETHRFYHTMAHLNAMFEQLAAAATVDDATVLAIVYHDIIYIPGAKNNEGESAKRLISDLSDSALDSHALKESVDLIEATADHQPFDVKSALFLDADMSILGAIPSVYLSYAENVQKEYEFLPRDIYLRGRKQFLNNLLGRERIFYSDHFYSALEKSARLNIENELQSLAASP